MTRISSVAPCQALDLLLLHWSTHPIHSRACQRPLSSCSSLTTSTWLVQRGLLPTTSKKASPSGLDFLTVGDFRALHWPMVTLPPLAPKIESSREKNLFRTSLFSCAGQKVSPLAGSRCWFQDCLSATDSNPDRLVQSRQTLSLSTH